MSYAGLVPSTHSSGGTTYHGRITKTGSPNLRWILNQCAWTNVRTLPEGKARTLLQLTGKKKREQQTITATSAKLLRIIYQMLKEKQSYHDG